MPQASLVEVADGVLVATHPFDIHTTTVVLGDGAGCLVVDPGVTAAEIDALATQLDARGRRVTAAFSTHPHWDHLLWRHALGDVPRYATAAGAAVARVRLAENRRKAAEALGGVDAEPLGGVTALAEPPTGPLTIPWGGPRVKVLEHRAHAPGHAAVLVEAVGVLVAGDMLSDVEIPLPDLAAEDPLGDYDRALDLFAGLGGADVVVPGHGTVGDRAELERRIGADRRYLAEVRAGRVVTDPRLAAGADWLRVEHRELVAQLAGRSRAAGGS
ncbi:MAG: MBL fold metallo-hydrolase [Georgenia sp.]